MEIEQLEQFIIVKRASAQIVCQLSAEEMFVIEQMLFFVHFVLFFPLF